MKALLLLGALLLIAGCSAMEAQQFAEAMEDANYAMDHGSAAARARRQCLSDAECSRMLTLQEAVPPAPVRPQTCHTHCSEYGYGTNCTTTCR